MLLSIFLSLNMLVKICNESRQSGSKAKRFKNKNESSAVSDFLTEKTEQLGQSIFRLKVC